MNEPVWTADYFASIRKDADRAIREGKNCVKLDPCDTSLLMDLIETHRRRDELVVAAAMAVLENGSATGSGTTLALVILEIYEGSPT
jgi:hypothetical protein